MGNGGTERNPLADDDSALELVLAGWLRVKRHLTVVVLAVLVGPAIAIFQQLQLPKVYSASVTLMVDVRPPRVLDRGTEVYPEEMLGDHDRFVNSLIRILQSEVIANRAEKKVGAPAGSLIGRVHGVADSKSHALTISVTDGDPDGASRLAKTFAEVFVEFTQSDRSGVTTDAAKFLSHESSGERKAVEADEKALYDFSRTNELPASTFEESHKIASGTLAALHSQMSLLKTQAIQMRAQLDELNAASDNPELQRALAGGEKGSDSPAAAYETEQIKLQILEARYGAQHPKVVEARSAVDAIRSLLDKSLATSLALARARLRTNESEQARLQTAIADETRKAVALRQKELEYNRLKRQLDEDRDTYGAVSKRQHEIELQAVATQGYVRWLEGPTAASVVPRQLVSRAAMAFVLSLLLGLVLAFLVDFIDDTFKSPFEAERELKPTLLGITMTFPASRSRDKTEMEVERANYLVNNPRSVIAEQCHSLATQAFSLFLDAPPRALMVVSPAVENGKTLVSVNLAVTAAARGKRVLLVDGDLRRGRLHRLFQVSKKGGLFELITQKVSIDEAVRSTFIPHVSVLTTGDVPEKLSPLRILEHRDLPAVLARLKEAYDLVIIDSPPAPLVSDALLLGTHVDGAIAVARAGKTTRKLATKLEDALRTAHVNLIGWVLNDVPEAELKSKYYYRYGYGRGYSYYQERGSSPS